MATIDELRALAREIREERQIGGNTGERVGNTFEKVADLLDSTGGDISDIREAVEQLLQDVGFIPRDISRTATDAVFTNSEGELLFWLRAATDTLAGLITAANNNKLIALPTAEELAQALAAKQNRLTFDPRPIEGSTNPVTSDGINTAIANFVTRSVSDLIYYYTKSETYTKEEVNALVAAIKQFVPVVAQTLSTPSADTMYKLYLIPSEDPQESNIKDEYITIDNGASANPRYTWEKIGSVDIDISGKADIGTVPADVTRTQTDATFVNNNHEPLFYLSQATSSLAGLMTAAEHNKLDSLPDAQTLNTSIESIIYDVSANHPTAGPNSDGKFTLAYILNPSNVNTLIPTAVRKGGMSIKFVQSSDNKYVQYRYMGVDATTAATFTNVANWQGVDDEPTDGSGNLVKSGGVYSKITKDKTFSLTGSSYYKYAQFNFVAGKKYRFFNQNDFGIDNIILSVNGDTTVVSDVLISRIGPNSNVVVEVPINAKGFRVSGSAEKVLRIVECLDVDSIENKSIGLNKLSDGVIESIDNKIAEKATDGEGIYTNKVVSTTVTGSYGAVKANFKKGRTYKLVKTSGSGINVFLSADGSTSTSQRVQDLGTFYTANPATKIFTAEVDGKGLTGYWQGQTITIEITEIIGTGDLNGKSVTSSKIGDGEVKNVNIENRTITEDKLAIYPADYVVAEKNRLLAELATRLQTAVSVFAFNTDQHISTKPGLTPQQEGYPKYVFNGLHSLKEITKKIPLDAIVLGGDIAGYRSDYDLEVEHILDECLTLLEKVDGSSCNIVAITGNHDDIQNNPNVTKEEMFNVLSKRNTYSSSIKLASASSCSCFVDDNIHKIRYIFVGNYNDTSENIIGFLTDKLSTLPADYNAIIFSHRPLSGTKFNDLTYTVEGVTRKYFFDPMDATSVIDTYASRIIACINGHGHTDAFGVSNGVLYIATTCACGSREPSMFIDPSDESQGRIPYSSEAGTYSDTAYDFFVIDQEAQTIEALRYGQGCNRKWYYKGDNIGLIANTPIIRE